MANRVIEAKPNAMDELDYLLNELYDADDKKDLTKSQIRGLFSNEKEKGKEIALSKCNDVIKELIDFSFEQFDYDDLVYFTKEVIYRYVKEKTKTK